MSSNDHASSNASSQKTKKIKRDLATHMVVLFHSGANYRETCEVFFVDISVLRSLSVPVVAVTKNFYIKAQTRDAVAAEDTESDKESDKESDTESLEQTSSGRQHARKSFTYLQSKREPLSEDSDTESQESSFSDAEKAREIADDRESATATATEASALLQQDPIHRPLSFYLDRCGTERLNINLTNPDTRICFHQNINGVEERIADHLDFIDLQKRELESMNESEEELWIAQSISIRRKIESVDFEVNHLVDMLRRWRQYDTFVMHGVKIEEESLFKILRNLCCALPDSVEHMILSNCIMTVCVPARRLPIASVDVEEDADEVVVLISVGIQSSTLKVGHCIFGQNGMLTGQIDAYYCDYAEFPKIYRTEKDDSLRQEKKFFTSYYSNVEPQMGEGGRHATQENEGSEGRRFDNANANDILDDKIDHVSVLLECLNSGTMRRKPRGHLCGCYVFSMTS